MRVAVVGCGAIGSPLVMQLLEDPAISELRVMDPDLIDLSNLPRQPWFEEQDVGRNKADRLQDYSPGRITAYAHRLTPRNSAALLGNVDAVFDASDNWEARRTIQRWSFISGRPWIFASALRTEGMAAFLSPETQCLYCLFGSLQQGPRCFEAGVLGPLTLAVAGQSLLLWQEYRANRGDPAQWPQGLFLVDGPRQTVRKIGMKAVRCAHGS